MSADLYTYQPLNVNLGDIDVFRSILRDDNIT